MMIEKSLDFLNSSASFKAFFFILLTNFHILVKINTSIS